MMEFLASPLHLAVSKQGVGATLTILEALHRATNVHIEQTPHGLFVKAFYDKSNYEVRASSQKRGASTIFLDNLVKTSDSSSAEEHPRIMKDLVVPDATPWKSTSSRYRRSGSKGTKQKEGLLDAWQGKNLGGQARASIVSGADAWAKWKAVAASPAVDAQCVAAVRVQDDNSGKASSIDEATVVANSSDDTTAAATAVMQVHGSSFSDMLVAEPTGDAAGDEMTGHGMNSNVAEDLGSFSEDALALETSKMQRIHDDFVNMHDAILIHLQDAFNELKVSPGLLHASSEYTDGKLVLIANVENSRCVMGGHGATFKALQSCMAKKLGLDFSFDRLLVRICSMR